MINKVILIGNLGADPEMKKLPSDVAYTRFRVATNENYKVNGEWQTKTEWHNIIIWRQAAERAAKQLKKGSLVYIEGKLTHRSWEDENGNKRYMTEITASHFRSLDKRKGGGAPVPEAPPVPDEPTTDNTDDNEEVKADDLPF